MRSPTRPVAAALAVLLIALPGAARAAGQQPGAESPEALVARFGDGYLSRDMAEMMACLTPVSRWEVARIVVAGTGIIVASICGDDEMPGAMGEAEIEIENENENENEQTTLKAKLLATVQQHFEEILERHGATEMMNANHPLPEEPAARAAVLEKMFEDTDPIALTVDLAGLAVELCQPFEEEELFLPPLVLWSGEVTDYRIEGDRATARTGDDSLRFVRLDGRWYFDRASVLPIALQMAP